METLNKILQNYVAVGEETANKLLGAAFIVTNKDGILYSGAAGRIDVPVESPAFTADSCSWVASLSKIITAATLMHLVEQGLIGLDDDTRPLVPELRSVQILRGFDKDGTPTLVENTKPITLRQLMTHTSGFAYDIMDPDLQQWSKAVGRTAVQHDCTLDGWNTPLKFPPGEGWMYSSGLDWAGQVLEKVTGKTLGQYMSDNIFEPLGMVDTTFHPRSVVERLQGRMVKCSFRDAEDKTLSVVPLPVVEEPPVESGGSGLHSTANDYAKFFRALLTAHHGASTILSKKTVDEMFRGQLTDVQCQMLKSLTEGTRPFPSETPINHGIIGLINAEDVARKRGKGSLTWGGMDNTHWWIDPEKEIAAVFFANVMPQPDAVARQLLDDLEQAVYRDLLP